MSKLKGLLLTEGMHGMISQVEGLAKALDLDFIHETIELNNFWKLIPPKITPVQNFVFKNKKKYKGEDVADILVKSPKKLIAINCSSKMNSRAIDEFLIIFFPSLHSKLRLIFSCILMSFAKDKLKDNKLNKTTKKFFLIMNNYTIKKISPNNVGRDYKF